MQYLPCARVSMSSCTRDDPPTRNTSRRPSSPPPPATSARARNKHTSRVVSRLVTAVSMPATTFCKKALRSSHRFATGSVTSAARGANANLVVDAGEVFRNAKRNALSAKLVGFCPSPTSNNSTAWRLASSHCAIKLAHAPRSWGWERKGSVLSGTKCHVRRDVLDDVWTTGRGNRSEQSPALEVKQCVCDVCSNYVATGGQSANKSVVPDLGKPRSVPRASDDCHWRRVATACGSAPWRFCVSRPVVTRRRRFPTRRAIPKNRKGRWFAKAKLTMNKKKVSVFRACV
jgi:hypothetical protein